MEIGGQRYILSTTQDVTDRKLAEAERDRLLAAEREARAFAEEALRMRQEFEAERRFRGLLESAQTRW